MVKERHSVSMKTWRWTELSAEHEVRYTGIERFLVMTMSRTSGVTDGLYGLVVGSPVQRSDRSSHQHKHVGVPPSRVQPRVPIHVFGVEVASHQDRQSPAETRGQFGSEQWAGGRKISRKEYHRSAGQSNVDGGSLQVGQVRNGH